MSEESIALIAEDGKDGLLRSKYRGLVGVIGKIAGVAGALFGVFKLDHPRHENHS